MRLVWTAYKMSSRNDHCAHTSDRFVGIEPFSLIFLLGASADDYTDRGWYLEYAYVFQLSNGTLFEREHKFVALYTRVMG